MERDREPRRVGGSLATALVLGAFLAVGGSLAAEEARADCGDLHAPAGVGLTQAGAPAPAAPPASEGGLRRHIDPQTAQFTEPPPGTAPGPPAAEAARSTSGAGLVETPSPIPGGGIMVDSQGRFQSLLVGTRVRIEDLHPKPGMETMP